MYFSLEETKLTNRIVYKKKKKKWNIKRIFLTPYLVFFTNILKHHILNALAHVVNIHSKSVGLAAVREHNKIKGAINMGNKIQKQLDKDRNSTEATTIDKLIDQHDMEVKKNSH